jgi:hypothetical protein
VPSIAGRRFDATRAKAISEDLNSDGVPNEQDNCRSRWPSSWSASATRERISFNIPDRTVTF